MGLILPPAVKTLSADNVTGANMAPDSDCREFILQDTADNPSLDSTVTMNGKTITRQPGFRWVFKCVTGSYFPNGVSIGTIKAGSAGTIVFGVEEN